MNVDILDELAFALHGLGYCGEVCVCVDDARALLPIVRQLCDLRAAEELDFAASAVEHAPGIKHQARAVATVRARAAALRGEAGR